MTPFLDVQDLTKSFGALVLFDHISFSVSEGQRVGLIAKNGTGKSTLLSILAGSEGMDSGKVIYRNGIKTAILPQTPHFCPTDTVMDACFNHRHDDELMLRAKQVLTQLHIADLTQPMSQLSGGQQKRVALANTLLTEPDLLILDEPTNHLDLQMIEWLEQYLGRGQRTLLMVTHDRYFLDRVCDTIIELDDRQLYTYRGSYAYYLEKRQERIDARRAEVARANNLYRTELEWMRRMPQARGHKAKYREDAFEELQRTAKTRIEERQVRLKATGVYIGNKIFECQYISKAFGQKVILKDFYYNFSRFEKLGIVGANGAGKSTFIKMLLGLTPPDAGRIVVGDTVRFGYFSQEGLTFNNDDKVIDIAQRVANYIDVGGRKLSASQFLQHFMFAPEQQQNFVYKLSGGERRKLYLCTVLMQNPNFLVLDEPTNDLDIQTLQILEQYLADFAGCVIIVSHDRYFMDRVVDHILVFQGEGQVQDFPGNYTQFRQWSALQPKADTDTQKNDTPAKKPYRNDTRRKLTFKEKREYEQLASEIEALEAEKKDIESKLSGATLTPEEITAMSRRLPALTDELDEKEMRWLELDEVVSL